MAKKEWYICRGDGRMKEYIEPLWCEDCAYFKCYGMDGEGECKAEHPREDVWYGRPACASFKAKESNNG